MASSKPTIIIIPGSFSPASQYSAVTTDLESHGYDVHAIDLETVGRRDTPPSMYDDAAKLAALITKLADEGKDVVLVPHSYGGVVACEASKGLAKSVREQEGKRGGVARIVFVTAVGPPVGQSIKDVFPPGALDSFAITDGYMTADPALIAAVGFSHLPTEEALAHGSKLLNHVAASFEQPITYAPYKDIPISFLICEDEKLIVPELQKKMIAAMESDMPEGKTVDRHPVQADHGIHLSQPKAMAAVVRRSLGDTA
ncbi:AB hydrolase-1 domain-containing protein [Favolaschia claudopus]|uniref:AB hydrolase-1 domain-containing protein n=1 Tax=Favolaschia claudopus TaxID=2862362 RepID=A0AAW0CW35_9AGAR